MISYFSGSTFNQAILGGIKKADELIFEENVENNQDFYKYIKQNIINLSEIDSLVLDISACINTDEEILNALEMLRTMYDSMKIIVVAPYYELGNPFLTKCVQMGICNIINTDDFRQIELDVEKCILQGMTYREAAKFKEVRPEKLLVKHKVKRAVNKRLIGVAGTETNIGTTHTAIILANYLRKQGFMVALAERAKTEAFASICDAYGENIFEEGYFTLSGVDFWPAVDDEKMQMLLTHSYNVIVIDFGLYEQTNKDAFERCEDRLVISGSKPWEMEAVNHVFSEASKEVLKKYTFIFNFTPESDYEDIVEGMNGLHTVFLNYTENPFKENEFPSGKEIFAEILPEEEEKEKKNGILSRFFSKKRGNQSATEIGPLES